MVTRIDQVIRLAVLVHRVLNKLYRIYDSLTPQEREAVRHHLRAIYCILRDVANRRNETSDPLPMLMMPPLEMTDDVPNVRKRGRIRFQDRSRQFRQNARLTARAIREYQSSFSAEDAREMGRHLNEVRKILSEAERRTRK